MKLNPKVRQTPPAWKQVDLAGGGLQEANLRLARLLKKRRVAYALLLAFPLGLHRAYLEDRRGAALFCIGTLLTAVNFATGATFLGWLLAAFLAGWALFDLWWIEGALARVNKRLRIEVYMHQTRGAPPGYKGRFTDEPPETGSRDPSRETRAPSFAEQEKQLRGEAAQRREERQ